MKTKILPIVFSLLFFGLMFTFPISPKANAESGLTTIAASQQGQGYYTTDIPGNYVTTVNLPVSAGSEIIVVVMNLFGNSVNPGNVSDSQNNHYTPLNPAGEGWNVFPGGFCGQFAGSGYACYVGTATTTASSTGTDAISMTQHVLSDGCVCSMFMTGYDITGTPVVADTLSFGSYSAHSNLAVTSYSPSSKAVVLTEALIAVNSNSTTFAGLSYTIASGQTSYASGIPCISQTCIGTSEYNVGTFGATLPATAPTTSPETSTNNNRWAEVSFSFTGGIYTVTTVSTIKVVACNFYELECWWEPLIFYGMYVGLWVGIGATMSIRARSMTYLFGAAVSYASLYLILLGELPYPFALMAFIGAFAYGLRLDGVF